MNGLVNQRRKMTEWPDMRALLPANAQNVEHTEETWAQIWARNKILSLRRGPSP